MKSASIILLFVLTQFLSFAQSINLKIKVYSTETNIPITNCNIALSEKYFGTTNNSGECDLEKVFEGNYLLKISHISFKSL